MLVIRREQIDRLGVAAQHRFEDEMVSHLRDHAPKLFELRGETCMRQLIVLAVQRAARWGFTNRGPIRFYLELMLALGVDFESDPQFDWVQDILRSPICPDQMVRANQLHVAVCDYFARVVGPDNRFALQALHRSKDLDLQRTLTTGAGPFRDRVIAGLREAYPEKCEFAGPTRLQRLVERAIVVSTGEGIGDEPGQALMVGLMFGFGHGVTGDPLYPWVRNTLERPDPLPKRLERLAAKTRSYMSAMRIHLGADA